MAADLFRKVIQPFVKRNNWSKAAQQQHFNRLYKIFDKQGKKYHNKNIPGATDMVDVTTTTPEFQKQIGQWNTFVYQAEPGKINRLKVWRDMSFFPPLAFALGEFEDEAITLDSNNNHVIFEINNLRLNQNENIVKNLAKEWNYISKDVFKITQNINMWFNEFMIDGEIMFEKVIDPINAKERGIIKIKRLRPEFTYPIWEELENDNIYQFVIKNNENIMIMPPESIAYANSGIYVYEDRFTKTVISYLDRAKINYRKLKQMEDSLVIYRLIKGYEKRVFNIEMGNLPNPKQKQYLHDIIRKYRQRKTFNPESGETSEAYDAQALVEDFFFAKQNGRGSSVEVLPGGDHLDEIKDVEYFLRQLYIGLRIPLSRISSDSSFSLGDTSDITREEVRFHKMVQKYVLRFSEVFKQVFMTHLKLKGYADEYGIQDRDITVKVVSDNLFQEYIESNITTIRTENLEKLIPYTESENGKPLLSKKFILKKYLKLTPEEMAENDALKKTEENVSLSGGGGGMDSMGGGGGMGGLDLGGDSGGDMGDMGGGGGSSPSDLGGDEGSEVDSALNSESPDNVDLSSTDNKNADEPEIDLETFAK
jgi:hypothetical protein